MPAIVVFGVQDLSWESRRPR